MNQRRKERSRANVGTGGEHVREEGPNNGQPYRESASIVDLDGVGFAYGSERVLQDVSLSLRRGDFLGVLGANGAGKSTLMRLMLGLAPASQGTVSLFGQNVARFREWWRVAYVPQRLSAFSTRFPATVTEVVSTGRLAQKRFGRLRPRDYELIRQAIAMAGLEDLVERPVHQLSSGQQQRVAIARALAGQPEFLVLDEPMTGIDTQTREHLYHLLAKLNREEQLTIAMVSHDIGATLAHARLIAYLQNGTAFVSSAHAFKEKFPALVCHVDPSHHMIQPTPLKIEGVPHASR